MRNHVFHQDGQKHVVLLSVRWSRDQRREVDGEHAQVANEECLDRRRSDFVFRQAGHLRDGRELGNFSALDVVNRRVGVAGVLVDGVNQSLLVVANVLHLAEDDPENAAQLLHVSQLVLLQLFVEALLLHHDVDELLLAVDANAQLGIDVLLDTELVRGRRRDLKNGAVDGRGIFADGALGEVVGVEPHEPVVAAVLPETLDGKLELRQAVVFGGELGAREEAQVSRLGLLAGDAVGGRAELLVRVGAVSAGKAAKRSDDGTDVRLDVSKVILVGERTVAENTEERVSAATLARLGHPETLQSF